MEVFLGLRPKTPPRSGAQRRYLEIWKALKNPDNGEWVAVLRSEVSGKKPKNMAQSLQTSASREGLRIQCQCEADKIFVRIRPSKDAPRLLYFPVPDAPEPAEAVVTAPVANSIPPAPQQAAPAPRPGSNSRAVTPQPSPASAAPPTPPQRRARDPKAIALDIETTIEQLLRNNDQSKPETYRPEVFEKVDLGGDVVLYSSYQNEAKLIARDKCGPGWKLDQERSGPTLHLRLRKAK
jgi:hypothetical protein